MCILQIRQKGVGYLFEQVEDKSNGKMRDIGTETGSANLGECPVKSYLAFKQWV